MCTIILTVVLPLATTGLAAATFPGANGRILFFRGGDGIYSVRPTGSGLEPVLPAPDSSAGTFSPDGTQVAFTRYVARLDKVHVFVMDADGSNLLRVSSRLRQQAQTPKWSPDGEWLVYEDFVLGQDPDTHEETYRGALVVVRPDGTDLHKITNYATRNGHPTWSPDSQEIAFTRGGGQTGDIWRMDADGANKVALTDTAVLEESPAWSPTGDSIVFERSSANRRRSGLVAIDSSGTTETLVTDGMRSDSVPQWSPDGSRIAFIRVLPRTDDQDLWTVGPLGESAILLTGDVDAPVDFNFAWSPNSNKLVYGLNANLFVAHAYTGERHQVTSGPGADYLGDWQSIQPPP